MDEHRLTLSAGLPSGESRTSGLMQLHTVSDQDVLQTRKRHHEALTWKPPAGHATWCAKQLPPRWGHYHVGDTPMSARGACTCGRSATAKSLRKLAAA